MADYRDDVNFTAGTPGGPTFAPDVPDANNYSGTFAPRGMLDAARTALTTGGATDFRNMGRAVAPAGFQALLARAPSALGGALRGGKALMEPAEQMFDMSRPAPLMGMLGMGTASADEGAAGRGFDQQAQDAMMNELRAIEDRRANAAQMTPQQQMADHLRRLQLLRLLGKPATLQRQADAGDMDNGMGMIQMAASGGDRLLGTGAAKKAADQIRGRKRRLDEEEDAATKTG